jgi:hypothetical protein
MKAMMRNSFLVGLTLLITVGATTMAHAQRPRRQMQSDEQMQGERGERPLRERMEGLRKVKLLEILELEGEAVERFFAKYTPLQRAVYDAKDAMDASIRALHAADKNNADDAAMTQRTADVLKKQEEFLRAVERRSADLKPHLSARQYARYVAFEAGFIDEVVRLMLHRIKR